VRCLAGCHGATRLKSTMRSLVIHRSGKGTGRFGCLGGGSRGVGGPSGRSGRGCRRSGSDGEVRRSGRLSILVRVCSSSNLSNSLFYSFL
jgi:hypothetical protein